MYLHMPLNVSNTRTHIFLTNDRATKCRDHKNLEYNSLLEYRRLLPSPMSDANTKDCISDNYCITTKTAAEYRCLLNSTQVCCRIPIYAEEYPSLLQGTDICWRVPKSAAGYQYLLKSTHVCCRVPISAEEYPSLLQGTDICWRVPKSAEEYRSTE